MHIGMRGYCIKGTKNVDHLANMFVSHTEKMLIAIPSRLIAISIQRAFVGSSSFAELMYIGEMCDILDPTDSSASPMLVFVFLCNLPICTAIE